MIGFNDLGGDIPMSGFLTADDLALRPGLLSNERILVTGGGTGIGRMIANGCAALGARVYICGRREAVLQETAEAINVALAGAASAAGVVSAVGCDIRHEESILDMLAHIWAD